MGEFAQGTQDADTATPSIASETMGAAYQINPTPRYPERGEETHPIPYLMPSVSYRNGNQERVDPAIVHTPLGAAMPNRLAIAPAVRVGQDWRQPVPDEAGPFVTGVSDSWPDGYPIPIC